MEHFCVIIGDVYMRHGSVIKQMIVVITVMNLIVDVSFSVYVATGVT